MHFFLDTAEVEEIRKGLDLGILDGVTTNPTLVAKTGRPFREVIEEICSMVPGPVSAEVVSLDTEGMIREGKTVAEWAENIVVKIPITTEGLKAINALSREGVRINTTLVFNPLQALMAAKAGAAYVSPFLGRLDDISTPSLGLVADIVGIFNNFGYETEVICASVRHPVHIVECARLGADIATMPYAVLEKLIKHPLTDAGIKGFLSDWEKVPDKPF